MKTYPNIFSKVWHGGRDAIEGMIRPVNSPQSSVLHLGFGLGIVAGAGAGAGALFPSETIAKPGDMTRQDWTRFITAGALVGSVLPVVLTAGAQVGTPSGRSLARGIHPVYFLGVGGIGGQIFINQAVTDALAN